MLQEVVTSDIVHTLAQPLLESIFRGDIDKVSMLLIQNPSLNDEPIDFVGNLPIHYLATIDSKKYGEKLKNLITILMPKSGLATAREDGKTALQIASERGDLNLIEALKNFNNVEVIKTNDIIDDAAQVIQEEEKLAKKINNPLLAKLITLGGFLAGAVAGIITSWTVITFDSPTNIILSLIAIIGGGFVGAKAAIMGANRISDLIKAKDEPQISLTKEQSKDIEKQVTRNYGATDIHTTPQVKISTVNSPLSASELSLPEVPNNSRSSLPSNRERSESSFLNNEFSNRHRTDTVKNASSFASNIGKQEDDKTNLSFVEKLQNNKSSSSGKTHLSISYP
ncbi:MAG: hypothetical protein ACK4OM_03340 [Alphaproteobacteria bacterium]